MKTKAAATVFQSTDFKKSTTVFQLSTKASLRVRAYSSPRLQGSATVLKSATVLQSPVLHITTLLLQPTELTMAPTQAEPNAWLYPLSNITSSIRYILSSIISSTGLLSHVRMERSAGLPESGSQYCWLFPPISKRSQVSSNPPNTLKQQRTSVLSQLEKSQQLNS